jgi:exoribonuclease R
VLARVSPVPSSRVVRVRRVPDGSVAASTLRAGITAIQAELEVSPAFADEVERVAAAAAAAPRLPGLDRTDIPFVTIDPPGATDLDQALHLERDGDGYVVHYAVADLAAFIAPGDAVDREAHRRGQTLYGADSRVPLHPPVISEGAGSLLPGEVRPALLWTIRVDADGETTDAGVQRAVVRSRRQLDYEQAQRIVDRGAGEESMRLLRTVGELRLAREAARGGVSLPLPEQDIDVEGDRWRLEFREMLPVESWNAQISLLTGFAAASLMVRSRVGILRTLPEPDARDVDRLRRTARALAIDWPADLSYPDFVRALDTSRPSHAAMTVACTRLLRGSGYVGFDGTLPDQARHAALASEYAHVTAPLRRLGDRYASEICVAVCAGQAVPAWVRERLDDVAGVMQRTGQLAARYEGAVLDLVEAGVLADRVGDRFSGVVVDVHHSDPLRGVVTLSEPAVEARLVGARDLPLGEEVDVVLETADVVGHRVEFRLP